jgi:hypothetical protein
MSVAHNELVWDGTAQNFVLWSTTGSYTLPADSTSIAVTVAVVSLIANSTYLLTAAPVTYAVTFEESARDYAFFGGPLPLSAGAAFTDVTLTFNGATHRTLSADGFTVTTVFNDVTLDYFIIFTRTLIADGFTVDATVANSDVIKNLLQNTGAGGTKRPRKPKRSL